ncbi:hypothetical protein ScPMuIL_004472 [Solemya velum]
MAERNRQLLLNLVQKEGNNVCAECSAAGPEWASCNLGIFLCPDCAQNHRGLGTDISRVKNINIDNWEDNQLQALTEIGNERARRVHEQFLPPFYRNPSQGKCSILRNEWILAKYVRREFSDPDKQTAYCSHIKEGYLMKRGKRDKRFQKRKFILSKSENKFIYYNRENNPKSKAEIDLDFLNAVFTPEKIGNPNGLQITFFEGGSTRNMFLYSENRKDIVDWYMAIRAAKYERKKIAFPEKDDSFLTEDLTRDFLIEGWMYKCGPRNEPYRKRWFTLDRRKLMYLEDPLDPYAKGEIFVGHRDSKYSIEAGAPPGKAGPGHSFTLHTPTRTFYMCVDSKDEMDQWVSVLKKVIDMPISPQDTKIASLLEPKRSSGGMFSR